MIEEKDGERWFMMWWDVEMETIWEGEDDTHGWVVGWKVKDLY